MAIDDIVSEFWAYFHRACAETAIKKLPVKNPTTPFAPATSITHMTDVFPKLSDVYGIFSMFFCATTSHDLKTLTFDLLTLSVSCTVIFIPDLLLSVSEL